MDSELEWYRWQIFPVLKEKALKHNVGTIFILGDCVDRKDRHSSRFVNRVVDEFEQLRESFSGEIYILGGNHDKPVNGPYFWKFLNRLGIYYIDEPTDLILDEKKIWLLPFAKSPIDEWKGLELEDADVIMIHQTVDGAMVERNRILTGPPLPILPRNIQVFSGDIHRPQTVNRVTYIGTPYPTRFSENWPNRIIVVENDDYTNYLEIPVKIINREIIDISSTSELKNINPNIGDQVKIRYKLTGANISEWPKEQESIRNWAITCGVTLVSIEPIFDDVVKTTNDGKSLEITKPDELIKLFSEQEKLSESVTDFGLSLIQELL